MMGKASGHEVYPLSFNLGQSELSIDIAITPAKEADKLALHITKNFSHEYSAYGNKPVVCEAA